MKHYAGTYSCSLSELLAMDDNDFETFSVAAISGEPVGVDFSNFVAIPESVTDSIINIQVEFDIDADEEEIS